MSGEPVAADGDSCRPFRERLSASDWSVLVDRGRQQILQAGDVLYIEGDHQQDVAVIDWGWAKVVTHVVDGYTAFLAVRGPGDILGEMAVLSSLPRSADVRSVEELRIIRFTHLDFLALLQSRPGISFALLGVLASRLRHADLWRVRCGSWSVEQRLTTLLVELVDTYCPKPDSFGGFSLPFSQEELGGFIGGSRKSVSRALYDLRRDGVVQTARRNLTVLLVDELRRRAGQSVG